MLTNCSNSRDDRSRDYTTGITTRDTTKNSSTKGTSSIPTNNSTSSISTDNTTGSISTSNTSTAHRNCSMVGNNSRRPNPRVTSNNSRVLRLLHRLLGASGADSVSTVLDDLDVSNSLAYSLCSLPWSVDRNLVTSPNRNTTADRG